MGLDKAAIVVVTYKRQELLQVLFDSLSALEKPIWRVVIVDNENSPQTKEMVDAWNEQAKAQWGLPSADAEGGTTRHGLLPPGEKRRRIGRLQRRHAARVGPGRRVVLAHGRRRRRLARQHPDPREVDRPLQRSSRAGATTSTTRRLTGSTTSSRAWASPTPRAPEAFDEKGYLEMNTACFEGGLFKRSIVQKIGVPDYRFFIYWDDTIYGYLASKHTTPVVVNDFIMRRTRTINNWDIAGKRKLNSTSDMNRYHIMRNRGYMARYLPALWGLQPLLVWFSRL